MTDSTLDGILKQAKIELREEIGYRFGRQEKLLNFNSHPGYIAHKVHLLVVYDLEWVMYKLDDALAATRIDYRSDP